jgi:hypothetical protein
MEAGKNNVLKYMSNPKAFTLKKWLVELLKSRYMQHDNIVERVATALITEKDLTDFGAMITDLYEIAYQKAVSDCKEEFEKLGVTINIVPSSSSPKNQD